MQSLINQLKIDEGFRNKAYHCTEGRLTIGYGYNLDANCLNLPKPMLDNYVAHGMLEEEASMLLLRCVNDCVMQCEHNFDWWSKLNKTRQDAITNMVFNIGIGKFLGFKNTIYALSSGDWACASKELLNSKWAAQVGARAQRIANAIKEG